MNKTEKYFNSTYEESRVVFRSFLQKIRKKWPQAVLETEKIGHEEDNTIDVIYSPARSSNEKVLFLTTGEHGIEGYAGAAVLQLFVEEYMDHISPETTGICLVHALNPWGMRHLRRVTENNVDLNRNYVYHSSSIPENINHRYAKVSELFLPNGKVKDIESERRKLYAQLGLGLMKEGYSGLKQAKGMGQFEFERGVYYGGMEMEESTVFLKQWQRKLLSTYQEVIHMDWHTALGPTNEITMVVSELDAEAAQELKKDNQLKNIQTFSPENAIGDSTNHFHKIQKEEFPETSLFSALFEFGTFGTDKKAELRELFTMVLENQWYWEGAEKEEDVQWIKDEFMAMFYPEEEKWREAVLEEARKGIEAVLVRKGLIPVNDSPAES